jgi:hypothetical protein
MIRSLSVMGDRPLDLVLRDGNEIADELHFAGADAGI